MIDSSSASRSKLSWATSKTIGGISEIAVLAPIRTGCFPGEQRTYEERLAEAIQNLADRHQQGFPTELGKISSIHFGRMIIIRPEQYLLYSDLEEVSYFEGTKTAAGGVPQKINDYIDRAGKRGPTESTIFPADTCRVRR